MSDPSPIGRPPPESDEGNSPAQRSSGRSRRLFWRVFLIAAAAYALAMLAYSWDFRPKSNAAALREADMAKIRSRLEEIPPEPAQAPPDATPAGAPSE